MIDLHCHVLPAIDDGPDSLEASLELARVAAGDGTQTIVATPHVNWEHPGTDAALIAERVDELNAELRAAGIRVDVRPGAELAATRAADLADDELRRLALGGGAWLLLECPLSPSAVGFERVAHDLQARGHRILLAHPERSPTFQRDPELLTRLVGHGMLAQVTTGALTGIYGRRATDAAWRMLADGLVHNIASDAHNAHGGRPPRLASVLEAAGLGPALATHFARDVPLCLLSGADVPPPPGLPRPPRRGVLGRLGLRRA